MDNEMIERVAKAIEERLNDLPLSNNYEDDLQQYEELSIAAIKAMREPTKIIKQVDCWSINYSTEEIWTKLIDFILKVK